MRRHVAGIDTPKFDDTPVVGGVDPSGATVAIVTSAGLHVEGHPGWARGDQSFNVIADRERSLRIGHVSPNFDRAGASYDLNVVFPLDRLRELAEAGAIGRVAPIHLSFMGAQHGNLSTIALDSGPAAGERLREAGVDVAVLTPVCPLCTRTLAAVAHSLERAGVATVLLALVREHVERMRPPRALYCEFPFGRPLGRPGDARFQTRVLATALGLVDRVDCPVLEEFAEAVSSDGSDAFSCAMPASYDAGEHSAVDEATALRPAYERRLLRTDHTAFGRVLLVGEVPDALALFVEVVCQEGRMSEPAPWDLALAALDIRSYYEESAMELSGGIPGSGTVDKWFFGATQAGCLLLDAQAALRAGGAPREVWYYLAPRSEHR